MRLLLLKSTKFANQAGYHLVAGRWHKTTEDKPAPKGAPKAAHPKAAGHHEPVKHLSDEEWALLKLPDTNTNAKTFNGQLEKLKQYSEAGDVTAILGMQLGTNTYSKKIGIVANHLLGLHGSEHKVQAGQAAGSHPAVQTTPEIEAEQKKPAAPVADNTPSDQPAKSVSAETVPAPSDKGEASSSLSMPEFADGKQAKGVKAHYEKTAKKIIDAAEAGDLSALQSMPTEKGQSWKGKTQNSKKLMELHQAAIEMVQGGTQAVKQPKPEPESAKESSVPKPDKEPSNPPLSLNGVLMNESWHPKTFANKTQAQKAADKLKEQGFDAHVTAQYPFKVKVNQQAGGSETKKDAALNAAIDHLKEDAQQSDLPAAEQKEDQALVSELEAAVSPAGDSGIKHKLTSTNSPALEAHIKQLPSGKWSADIYDTQFDNYLPNIGVFDTEEQAVGVFGNGWKNQAAAEPAAPAVDPQPDATDKLSQIPWDKMLLPDSNKNAKSHNGKVAHIKAMAEAGDIEGLKNFKAGVNTYGKKQNLLAQTALAALEESAAAPAPAAEAKPEPALKQSKADEPTAQIKPEHPAGTPWALHVDKIESFKDDVPWLTDYVENTEVKSESGKSALDYAKALLRQAKSNQDQDAVSDTDNDGPQEGETKQGADGTLVFHNGRWHKQGEEKAADKPAPASPAEVDLPTFNGPNATHNKILTNAAAALKEKIAVEGKAGFKGVLTNHKTGHITVTIGGAKIAKASVNSKTPGLAEFAKFVDELKASAGAVKAPKPKAAQAAPVPSYEPEPQKQHESMDSWTQTGGQGGSNPGGKFKDPDSVEWYCKFPPDEEHAKAEVLAAKLYTALGLNAQDAKLITKDGKIGIASRWQEVKKASPGELTDTKGALAGFAADAWLANWDVVGMGFDNLQVDEKGNAMRVDAGGSIMYRAQGGKKAFGDTVTELDSLRDPKLNPQSAAVFGKMTKADITASVAKVAQISDAKIRMIVTANGPGTKAERKALADTLIARKNDLLAKYPKAAKPSKKRLDPNNLPVANDQLPKRHDFENWNGPSQPLSSKAHVNEANQKVEDEALAIAKSGNLNKLKEYKFQPVDKDTGQPVGDPKPISEHPSKHVVQYHADLVQLLDEIANPPQPLKIFQEFDVNTLDELEMAFPPKKFGTTVNAVSSNEKLGFWVVLGGVHGAEKFKPKKLVNFTQQAITSAYDKFKEASKLAKHFVHSVQASGSYNDLFRDGKTHDQSGNKLADVAQAALEFATEQPEGTGLYRWQNMSDEMVKKILGAPEGSVFQATGPMCTSYSPTSTSHFGKHRVTIRYAKGAKAVESFGSGKFAGEKEITTLPNSRFVILERKMVPNEKGSGERLELEVLMLPPDLGV